MKEMSRRNFFSSLLPQINLTDQDSDQNPTLSQNVLQTAVLGPVSLFPVHTVCKINLFNQNYVLHSLPEGIQLFDEKSKVITRLSLGSDGQLYAHLGEHWPDNSVLSLFTGDIYNI